MFQKVSCNDFLSYARGIPMRQAGIRFSVDPKASGRTGNFVLSIGKIRTLRRLKGAQSYKTSHK